MKILLTGSNGQLGQSLQAVAPYEFDLITSTRKDLDLSDPDACKKYIERLKPDWVINAGAYTAVDKAEKEVDLAMAINAAAPAAFAEVLAQNGGCLLQISTDFVFNGLQGHPYSPEQSVDPLGVYGKSKALGEKIVLEKLGKERRAHILRTSWIYGPVGHNFCLTMLKLHAAKAQTGEVLGVVVDQVGCPTSTHTLAEACWRLISLSREEKIFEPILHWSDAGVASWYDFACAIGELGVATGLLDKAALVQPLSTVEYPTAASRPAYSLLDVSQSRKLLGLHSIHWRKALVQVLERLRTHS